MPPLSAAALRHAATVGLELRYAATAAGERSRISLDTA
jgi:hypothetical protein